MKLLLLLIPDPTVARGWQISIPAWRYFLYCIVITVSVRIAICIFKGWSVQGGTFSSRFFEALGGFSSDPDLSDYWLTAIIGFCEAAAYPVLIFLNQGVIIGGWLAIKTAGHWSEWEKSRTTFNRFPYWKSDRARGFSLLVASLCRTQTVTRCAQQIVGPEPLEASFAGSVTRV